MSIRAFEAYMRPERTESARKKHVYIVGGGLAGLSAALFLIRDAGVPGKQVHILEKEQLPGGACDGYFFEEAGYIMRGDHKLDGNNPCLADLMNSLPSPYPEGGTLLEEFVKLDREDPNYSLCRLTEKRGQKVPFDGRFGLSDAACSEIFKLLLSLDEELAEKRIQDVLSADVTGSLFWLYLSTCCYFQKNHSAGEFKISLQHHIDDLSSLPDLGCFHFLRYNIYDALITPLVRELEREGVEFRYGVRVTDVAFDCAREKKRATRIDLVEGEEDSCIDLGEQDMVLISLGSSVENSTRGSQYESAAFRTEIREGGSFALWKRISEQDPSFGNPDVFSLSPEESCLMTATVTTKDKRIVSYIKKICKRDPFSGRTVTGGPVTIKDSPWLLSWSVARQPLFAGQSEEECIISLSGLQSLSSGEYVEKPMRNCSGEEICREWLYHLGVPTDQIDELAREETRTIPVMMPFATAALLPRQSDDRPEVRPHGAENFAFIGQFVRSETDTASSSEYAVRTGMEAVYRLFSIEADLPDSIGRAYDLRALLEAAAALRDGRSVRDMSLKRNGKTAVRKALKLVRGTSLEKQLMEKGLL